MARERTFIATVQIVIHPSEQCQTVGDAEDYFSALLTDNNSVLDWSYLKIGAQICYPSDVFVDPDTYFEGEIFGY